MLKFKIVKQVFFISALLCILFLAGCPMGDKVIWPTLVKGTFDTFTIKAIRKEHKIKSIVLSERYSRNIVWQIDSICPVLVKGFSVRVGVVPRGFKQLVPDEQERFILDTSKEYRFLIITDNINERFNYASTIWTSDGETIP